MTDRKVCGAPGREEEEGIDLTCDLEPHSRDTDHHAVIISPYIREPIGEMWWPVAPPKPHEQILRIVSATVTEANDVGGIDLNDLVTRLETAGFELPPESP